MPSAQSRPIPSFQSLSILLFLFLLLSQTAKAASDDEDQCFDRRKDVGIPLQTGKAGGCEIPGSGDFYGLGVRLGVYLTWLTSWIANNFVKDEMPGALDTNSIFLFALLMCVAALSAREEVFTIDNLILVQLTNGFLFGVMSLWGYRTRFWKKGSGSGGGDSSFGGWGTHIRLLLCFTVSCYNLWFWVWNIAHPDPVCFMREECGGLQMFFFSSVAAAGWMRYTNAMFSATCCLYYGIMVIVAAFTLGRHLVRRHTKGEKVWIPAVPDRDNVRRLSIFYKGIAGFNIQWMAFTIASVELTLNWNNVAGVTDGVDLTSAGQLLALLIGIFSTIRIFWIVWSDRREKAEEQVTAEGHGEVEFTADGHQPPAPAGFMDEVKTAFSTLQSVEGQRKGKWVYSVLDTWLPWLNCFESWRRRG